MGVVGQGHVDIVKLAQTQQLALAQQAANLAGLHFREDISSVQHAGSHGVGMGVALGVDLLFLQGADPVRVQCAFVDTPEVESIVDYIGSQIAYPTAYLLPEYVSEGGDSSVSETVDLSKRDPLFEDAARLVVIQQQGSTSLIQRKFSIGYNRAGRVMDQLEAAGIVGPFEGSKARQVLIVDEYSLEQILNSLK